MGKQSPLRAAAFLMIGQNHCTARATRSGLLFKILKEKT